MRVATLTSATLLALAIAVPTSAQAQSFQGLGFPPGATISLPLGISSDGNVVVGWSNVPSGFSGDVAFRWTSQGFVNLGVLPGYAGSHATAANADGSVVVGNSFATATQLCCGDNVGALGIGVSQQTFRWTQSGGMVGLGFLPGGTSSVANGVSADGSVVVGTSNYPAGGGSTEIQAYRWTQSGRMVGLGFLPGHSFSSATGVSADGSVVVGHSNAGLVSTSQAFRWTASGGMAGLGTLPGYTGSFAWAVSGNGSTVVGGAFIGNNPDGSTSQAFRWTATSGMVGLGFVAGDASSIAFAVNADGSVVVGQGAGGPASGAFRWTAADGMQSIKTLLTQKGVNLTGWQLTTAFGVSADGNVMAGRALAPGGGTNFQAWIARLSGGTGLITLSNTSQSFASLQGTVESGHGTLNANLGTLAEIAQHHDCKSACMNVYGLYSAERGPSFDDPGYLGTVGLAKALTRDVSAGVTVGIGSQRDDLASGSSDKQRTVSGGVHLAYTPEQGPQAIGGGIISRISTTIDRGYLNGNTPVTSTGDTKGTGIGGIVRLGWAARVSQSIRVMPFADYEITRARYSAYTETTGPFPATINAIDDTQQRTRLGAEARYWFTPLSYVWGTAAWGHRLTGTMAPISGTLIGLFDIGVPGSAVTRDWTETTAGFRYALTKNAVVTTSLGARLGGGNSAITFVRSGFSVSF